MRAYDPEAMDETRRLYPDGNGLTLCKNALEAVTGADALAIVTEWQEFRSPDFQTLKEVLRDGVIFDGRNLYDPHMVESIGLAYYGVGRGRSVVGGE